MHFNASHAKRTLCYFRMRQTGLDGSPAVREMCHLYAQSHFENADAVKEIAALCKQNSSSKMNT